MKTMAKERKTKKEWDRKKPRIWTEANVRKEALRYKTLKDFFTYSSGAYEAARKNGWLSSYVWLERKERKPWTEESVLEESKKYCSINEFREKCQSGWRYARATGVLSKITWFIDFTPEFRKWMSELYVSVYRLLCSIGLSKTKEWLFLESGKEDVYTFDQRRLLKRWSEIVNEKWASWKKYRWYYYDDMNYGKRRLKGDKEEDMDDGLHIKP